MADVEQQENGEQDLWSSILSDVQSSATRKLRAHKSILLLGNDESGKSTLISKIRGKEDEISKGHGLEYTYLDVHDEELDDYTRLNVWILDGDARNKTLLKYALTPQNVNDSLVVLVVDSSKPWTIMDSLHSWTEVLREHIHSLKLTPTQFNEMEETIAKQFQEYIDPDEAGGDENKRRSGAGSKDEEKVLLPLDEDVLVDNLGLPVVVVVTKTDGMGTLEKDRDYREEHFDFIQQHIRRYCLKYGAALFYTSVKENKNCNIFLKYLLHRIYGLPFNSSALVVDKDSVFIPSGWDSMKKISIMNEHLKGIHPEDNFDDHIVKPIQRKPLQEKEIMAEEEQEFLVKQQQMLLKNPPSVSAGMARQQPDITKPRSPGSPAARMTDRRQSGGTPASGRPKVDSIKGPAGAGAATNEGVLANFFNSLLNKKTGAAAPGTPQGRGVPSARSDAAAELDRMNRSKKLVGQPGSGEDADDKS